MYKCYNKVKVFVVIVLNGYIMFILYSYGGRVSDSFIIKFCGFLNLLRFGDDVMIDCGFIIGEDFFVCKVKFNIFVFMKGRIYISEKEIIELKCIVLV